MRFLCLVAAWLALSAQAAPLTIEQATNWNGVTQASISPDGKTIAFLVYNGVKYKINMYFPLTQQTRMLELHSIFTEVKSGDEVTPNWMTWAGNDLLVLDFGGLAISVNRMGMMQQELGTSVIQRIDNDSSWMLMYTDLKRNEIALVNASNGEKRIQRHPPGELLDMAVDPQGMLRAVTLFDPDADPNLAAYTYWYLPVAGGTWQKISESGVNDDHWKLAYVPDKPNTLAVYSREGRDTYALFYFDTEHRMLGEMLAGHATEDILAVGGIDQPSYHAVVLGGLRPQRIWLKGPWIDVQRAVDAALPGRINRVQGNPHGKVLVYSYSDTVRGEWYLLDREKSSIGLLASRSLSSRDTESRPMETMQYSAKDGLNIPAFLTRPADGARHSPLVVLIHGGPWVRDYWGWDAEVQLLAAQGYAVFQPQFRGSSGFGKKFEEASYGQWGLAMQDDITAGVQHLIAQGIADPKRICIVGASYGGYAALWGLVKTPELYQCGASFAGVTDITHMTDDHSDRAGSKIARAVQLKRIGEAIADPRQAEQVSPLKQAGRIRAPVLLVHGELDKRVPISHGLKMKEALEREGKQVEWLKFEDEGHGFNYIDNQRAYYKTLLAFLDKHIGKAKVD